MATQTGEFSQTYVEDLLAPVLKAVVAKAKLDPARYPDDVMRDSDDALHVTADVNTGAGADVQCGRHRCRHCAG